MTSRQQLYAAWEPLGDSATRRKPGGRIYGGGGGGSSSSAASSTTINTDKRNTVGPGGAAISGDGSSIVITDSGIVSRALDTVDINNALMGQGLSSLLDNAVKMFNNTSDNALKMFNTSEGLIGQTQKSVADAYSTAQTDKAGSIDQKTMIVLAIAAAGTVYAIARK